MKAWVGLGCWGGWLCLGLLCGSSLLAQGLEPQPQTWQTQAGEMQTLALSDPTPAHLYNAGVAWEQAQQPVKALYFYRQARALGLPLAAKAQARVEASLQIPPSEALVLPSFELWAAALGLISLASALGVLHLLRPRRPLGRLAWGLAGLGGAAGLALLLQAWILAPGPTLGQASELRRGPGLAFPVISQVPAGAMVRPQETRSGWVKLTYEQQQGWLPQGGLLQ